METAMLWSDQIPEKDGVQSSINDIAISPDGSKLIAAVGNRVLLYNTENGELIESLRGHKDTVYSVSFSSDGSRFASGGADHIVVIWKSSGQGLLKYNHTAPIQRVTYNPSMLLLASCSDVDFGLWSPDQKQVTKEKVPSRITSAAWSSDGSLLAIGMLNGVISLRNQQTEEIQRIERKAPIGCLVFIPDFYPPKAASGSSNTAAGSANAAAAATNQTDSTDLLAVGCWDKTYSLYRVNSTAQKLQTEKQLKYYPCSISYALNSASKSTYLIISGSNKKVTLYSREGSKLTEVYQKDSWIWCVSCHGDSDCVALGSNSGSIDYVQMKFPPVHTLYRDRYSYRENLTEVIVHHLVTDKKVRIKCKDLIRNLSLYRNKLAVLMSDRVSIYESSVDDVVDMHFRIRKEKIWINVTAIGDVKALPSAKDIQNGKSKSNILMAITSNNLLFCRDNVIELFTFNGQRQRVWTFESKINCLRVDGGIDGREGVFVGLHSGTILKVYVDNLFPLEILKRANCSIMQLDVNLYRTMIASVDSKNVMTVVDVRTQETIHTVSGVVSVTFNTEVEDLICITGADSAISVISGISSSYNQGNDDMSRAGKLVHAEMQEQHIYGLGLGFRGQRIYCLYKGGVIGVDVPQGWNMQRALDVNDFWTAYKIACLGATEADWKLLAMRSLRANYLTIAKNSFARLKDTKYLSLIDAIERRGGNSVVKSSSTVQQTSAPSAPQTVQRGNRGNMSTDSSNTSTTKTKNNNAMVAISNSVPLPLEPMWMAELMAYEGHHNEAAKIYARSGKLDEAIRLFTDLRRWEDAKMFARNAGQVDVSHLNLQQAKWLQEINNWKGAAELYVSMGQYMQAAKIVAENQSQPGWQESLIEVVRACPADNVETLEFCGDKFASSANDTTHAREAYIKAKDISKLMALYAKRHMWKEAAKLADENEGKFDVAIFLSYAEWLVSQDRYMEAIDAFKKSKRVDLAKNVLKELTANSVSERRFKDAAYYYWLLSKEVEVVPPVGSAPSSKLEESKKNSSLEQVQRDQPQSLLQSEYEQKADLYFAYSNIHSYVTDPFTSQQPEMLFQVSRFIINSLGSSEFIPAGISKAATLYTLAKQSMTLGAYKLARYVYDRLSKLQLPNDRKTEEIEIDMLLVQAKPVRDDPDHLPVCYRCSSTNPLLNPFNNKFAKGDVCTNCGHPFVRSFINFDILPLVEFVPEPSITDEEAIEYIRQPPPVNKDNSEKISQSKVSKSGSTTVYAKKKGWKETKTVGNGAKPSVDRLSLMDGNDEDDDEVDDDDESFIGRKKSNSTAEAIAGRLLIRDEDEDEEDTAVRSFGNRMQESGDSDHFARCLNDTLEKQKTVYTPVQVDVNTLEHMKRSEVFVCRPSSKLKRATFYRNMLPEIPIAISQPCHRFFHLEDFEFAYLSEQKCPYSRLKNVGEYGSL